MDSQESSRKVFVARLILGLAQGLALYLLYSAYDHKAWRATDADLFAPLVMVALYIPLVVLQGLGNLRIRTLLIWTGAATLLLAGLAFYDIWRAWPGAPTTPSGEAFFVCAVFLFVAHALVSCGDADRKIVANYPTLFDLAWKLGVQIAIAACFVGSFWLMIWLGIALFNMIKLTGFQHFIEHPWVWIPLTTLATAVSIHITDTRANLVRGVRTLALTLLGWLLPVITGIAFAFLISLMITGLQPLFETRAATFLLMAAAAVLVIHINAVYQDGNPDQRPHHILRVAGTLASVLLVFIVAIAGYALSLRIAQYGWTANRITAAACVVIAAMFAVGYLVAAILPGLWLKLIERWNVYGTFLFLILLFALATPIADPARLSVNDQVARLNAGLVKAEKFDFNYLHYRGGRYGAAALTTLEQSQDPKIAAAVRLENEDLAAAAKVSEPLTPEKAKLTIQVHPDGRTLPPSFFKQSWEDDRFLSTISECLTGYAAIHTACDAVLKDIDGDGQDEILLINWDKSGKTPFWDSALIKWKDGRWQVIAEGEGRSEPCGKFVSRMLAGDFKAVPSLGFDLAVGGARIRMFERNTRDICH